MPNLRYQPMPIMPPPNGACTREQLYQRETVLNEVGFTLDVSDDRSYAAGFVGEGQRVYLKKTEELSIVLSPTSNPRRIEAAIEASGVQVNNAPYHSSSLANFQKRRNAGRVEEHYGIDVDFASPDQMKSFLAAFAIRPPLPGPR